MVVWAAGLLDTHCARMCVTSMLALICHASLRTSHIQKFRKEREGLGLHGTDDFDKCITVGL